MNRCPITYELCEERLYSAKGLRLLAPKLKELKPFPFTPQQQRDLAFHQVEKISIQGTQPKLSVQLSVAGECFNPVARDGSFILKPPHYMFEELPQNEDVTMRLAKEVGLEVPLHGLLYNIDGSLTYFIKRFDRLPRGRKYAVEDCSQLLGGSRDTKHECSMEKLISVIDQHCSFPRLERIKLFRLTVFNFLVGNEDAHVKNFSLIRREEKVELSPLYDLLNSTIALPRVTEEIALPLRGKKSKLSATDLFDYFGKERLGLSESVIEEERQRFRQALPRWHSLLMQSFLSEKLRNRYLALFSQRQERLWL